METRVVTWPLPHTEMHSDAFRLEVEGVPVPVWLARVREAITQPEGCGWSSMLGGPTDWASFARFDAVYPVEVAITVARPFQSAEILPQSAGVEAVVEGDRIRFTLDRPRHLTLCLDGSDEHSLHCFCRETETDVPAKSDPNTIYFGPGEHWIHSLDVKSGQTVYLDGGAILRATLPEGAKGKQEGVLNLTHYGESPVIKIAGVKNVRICGRGILDGSLLPHPARNLMLVHSSSNARIEGVTLRNSPNWHLPIMNSHNVVVENIACLSGRLNSDGVNCVNSSHIVVRDVFVRSHDDSFVVKTTQPQNPAHDILYENCIAWNDWGYAFGVSYETRSDIRDVTFRDCNVIFARNWAIGIHLSDSGTVGPVRFERIGVLYPQTNIAPRMNRQSIKLNIGRDEWGNDDKCGHIRDITFRDISITGGNVPPMIFHGFDADHVIEKVKFTNLTINGKVITSTSDHPAEVNEHVRGLVFR